MTGEKREIMRFRRKRRRTTCKQRETEGNNSFEITRNDSQVQLKGKIARKTMN
jgi:hypothetical protein